MPEDIHKVDRKNKRELIERIQFISRNYCKNIRFKTDQKKKPGNAEVRGEEYLQAI